MELESKEYHRTRTSFSFAINTGFTKGRGEMIYAGNQINGKRDTPTQRRACTLVSVTSKSAKPKRQSRSDLQSYTATNGDDLIFCWTNYFRERNSVSYRVWWTKNTVRVIMLVPPVFLLCFLSCKNGILSTVPFIQSSFSSVRAVRAPQTSQTQIKQNTDHTSITAPFVGFS